MKRTCVWQTSAGRKVFLAASIIAGAAGAFALAIESQAETAWSLADAVDLKLMLGMFCAGTVAISDPLCRRRGTKPDPVPGCEDSADARPEGADPANLLNNLLEHCPDHIYFKDRNSRLMFFSRSFCDLLNSKDPASLVGKTDFDLYTHEHAQDAFDDEQRILETGEPLLGKLEKETHHGGEVTWAMTNKLPWRDAAGNIVGTFGISKDVTELKQAEWELEVAHKRLVQASRLAGMAEVATDVLHNVGNVLNSVNVAASLATERAERFQFDVLGKIPKLLEENAGRLDEYLTTDPQGRKIPQLLSVLGQTYTQERNELVREMAELRNNIDHIKQVVGMQQNYAKVAGAAERLEVAEIVEDALRINSAALQRHCVELRRDFAPVPPVLVDKHRVLQIIVNLVSNAKYAVSEMSDQDRIVIVRIRPEGDDEVRIDVEDNGTGISAENLVKIFAHGFTTKRDGHGFGLHSGALAARELGGKLSAHSDGINKGATFSLVLPLMPPAPQP